MKRQILIKHERSSNHWSWYHNQVFTTRLYDLCCGLMQNPGTIIDSIRSRNACDARCTVQQLLVVGVVRYGYMFSAATSPPTLELICVLFSRIPRLYHKQILYLHIAQGVTLFMFGRILYSFELLFVLSKHYYEYNTVVTDFSSKGWL